MEINNGDLPIIEELNTVYLLLHESIVVEGEFRMPLLGPAELPHGSINFSLSSMNSKQFCKLQMPCLTIFETT